MTRTHSTNRIMRAFQLRTMFAVLLLIGFAATSRAQDKLEGIDGGDYQFNVGLTAGYRSSTLTNADGSLDPWAEKRYNEAFNLQKGIHLNSFDIYGQKKGTEGFFDELFVTADGINDPFTTGTLRMRSFNSYDLRVDFRNAKYYLNRNDSLFSGLHKYDFSRNFLNASLDVNLMSDVKANLQFNSTGRSGDATLTHNAMLELTGPSVKGTNSGPYWINVPRDDKTTDLLASLNWQADKSTNITLGGGVRSFKQTLDGSLVSDTPLTYTNLGTGIYTWDSINRRVFVNPFSGMYGGYVLPNVANGAVVSGSNPNFLTGMTYTQTMDYTTPYFFFEGISHPVEQIVITANARYENSEAKPTLSLNQSGLGGSLVKQKNGTYLPMDSAYAYSLNGSSISIKTTRMVGSVNVMGQLMDNLSLTGRYAYTKTTEEGAANYAYNVKQYRLDNSLKLDTSATGMAATNYSTPQQDIEGFFDYSPFPELGMKAGLRYSVVSPTVTYQPDNTGIDEEVSAHLSEKTTAMTPYVSFNYRPTKNVRFDGRFSNTTNKATDNGTQVDMPIRIVPESINAYSIGVQAELISHLRTGFRFNANDGKSTLRAAHLDSAGEVQRVINLTERPYTNKMQSITGSVGYQFSKELGVNVSGEYRANTYEIPITWSRGAANAATLNSYVLYGDKGTTQISQNTIDRYLDISLMSQPIEALHLEAGFSLMSSTGGVLNDTGMANQYSATNPKGALPDRILYGGPYHQYQLHATATYDITPNIGVMMDYERMMYQEDKVPYADYYALNNFLGSLIRGGIALKL